MNVFLDLFNCSSTLSLTSVPPPPPSRPLLPTQLLQTFFALISQTLLLAYVITSGSTMRVGMVSVLTLTAYSVGRLLFFMVREDEVRI